MARLCTAPLTVSFVALAQVAQRALGQARADTEHVVPVAAARRRAQLLRTLQFESCKQFSCFKMDAGALQLITQDLCAEFRVPVH